MIARSAPDRLCRKVSKGDSIRPQHGENTMGEPGLIG